ncbi:SGNH/GDSL hydrolase family protein [Curtobacterium sp. MCPF17_002]|uniref:SGNH/GDSL hydrolase family protein n=1 Tax=Curtobacterium sp. MCPF17_002 TaxID=2175645 RepID=UPI0015E8AA2F|nr:SGNH/GDSL hydrolase family protein [Curtobacterium sp. MCPF17_002]WIB77460.1 SGNH/GDSL hydrolase family protein [Curtobacterium sp. MCPF17_002]
MPRPRRLALIASIVTACLVAGSFVVGSIVIGSIVVGTAGTAGTAAAESNPTASAAQAPTRVERAAPADVRAGARVPVREQVVSGALGSGDRPGAITFAYAGDSISARPDSWLHVLEPDTRFHAVGGYAHSGYRADQVLDEVRPVPEAEVLVVELGTNDVNQAVPTATTIADVDAVVRKVGAQRVLVVAGPPSDWTNSRWGADRRTGQIVLSRALERDAAAHGWSFVDPFTAFRRADGAWVRGSSPDGIHGTAAANVVVAQVMATAITEAVH